MIVAARRSPMNGRTRRIQCSAASPVTDVEKIGLRFGFLV